MIDLDENRKDIKAFKDELKKIYTTLNIENKTMELEKLEKETLEQDFWNNNPNSNSVLKEIKEIKNKLKKYNEI